MRLRTTCCAALVLLLLGCTQASVRPQTSPVTVEELLSGTALGQRQPAQALVDEDENLALSPEMARFLDSYDRRVIPDSRAFAHYYNNLGAEHMLAGDRATALAYFRKALFDNDRSFSPARPSSPEITQQPSPT